jgi:hypothetical protein
MSKKKQKCSHQPRIKMLQEFERTKFKFVLEQLIEEVVDDDKYLLFHCYYEYLHDHLSVLVYYDDYFHFDN